MGPSARRLALLLTALLGASVAGCDEEPDAGPPDHTYTARGTLQYVPSSDEDHPQLVVFHEPIEGWVDREGNDERMEPMMMSFTPAEDIPLDTLATGDKVEFTFEVRWDAKPMMKIVGIDQLPPDTKLDLPEKKGASKGKGKGS